MTGHVIRNDGDVAIVKLENGERVRFDRAASIEPKTRDEFLRDLAVGPLRPSIDIQKEFVQ